MHRPVQFYSSEQGQVVKKSKNGIVKMVFQDGLPAHF